MRVQHEITVECDVPEGVESVAMDEVRERISVAGRIGSAPGKVWFEVPPARAGDVVGLRTIAGAWIVERYRGRRPSVIVGDQRVASRIRDVVRRHPDVASFTLSAPGRGSPAMRDVRSTLVQQTGLREEPHGLLVRMRRVVGGWETLVALSPAALAERTWRVVRSSGAVNGPLAAAIVRLTRPDSGDRFLNVACGSATFAIERRLAGPAATVVGVDLASEALRAASVNVRTSGTRVDLVLADARRLPFARGTFDVFVTDPPWGYEIGSHDSNVADYAALLAEAGRVTRRRARACVLTAETRLMQRVLGDLAALWRLDQLIRVEQGGARPGLFLLRRA